MEHHWVRINFGRLAAGGKQDRTTTKAVETLLSLSDSFSSSEFFPFPRKDLSHSMRRRCDYVDYVDFVDLSDL